MSKETYYRGRRDLLDRAISANINLEGLSLLFSVLASARTLNSQCPSMFKVTMNGTFQDFCPSFLPCPIIRAQIRVRPSAAEHTGEVFCILHAPRTRPVAVTARIEHSPLSATKPISSSPSTGAIMKLQSLFSALFAAIMLTRLLARAIRARRWGTATRLLPTGAKAAADEHAAARITNPSTRRMLALSVRRPQKKEKRLSWCQVGCPARHGKWQAGLFVGRLRPGPTTLCTLPIRVRDGPTEMTQRRGADVKSTGASDKRN